jgi:Fungal N-terminal domain of STAND proteins
MDPLSVTASVVGLTATCVQTAKALSELKDKFQHAHMTIAAIITETTIISASLSRIQSLILSSPDTMAEKLQREGLETTLDSALTGCYVVFDVLQTEIHKVMEAAANSNELSFKARIRYIWSEGNMQDSLNQLRGLQTALSLLLQLFGTYVSLIL